MARPYDITGTNQSGDSGTASVGGNTTYTDSTKAWGTNQWAGGVLTVGAESWAVISNTATVLTVAEDLTGKGATYTLFGDEVVVVTTLLPSGLYQGWALEDSNSAVAGNTSPTYGAWTGAGKTGTRLEVLLAGTPSTNQIYWNINTGEIRRDTSGSIYVRYKGFGQIFRVRRPLIFSMPWLLVAGQTTIVWATRRAPQKITFSHFTHAIDSNLGSTGNATLTILNTTTSASVTATFDATARTGGPTALSAALVCSAGDVIQVKGDGEGISGVTITLLESLTA